MELVNQKLKERIKELDASICEVQRDIEEMHEYYWENYTEMDQYGYEDFDNQQALLHQINANTEKRALRRRFRRMADAPFFGSVQFRFGEEEQEDAESETFYIGIGNFAQRAGQVPLIYDWRAPVSGLFYDYDRGPAAYEAPSGRIEGEVLSKWQYKIRGGRMIYEFESDIKIDDEILKAELGSRGDVQLKNIVRTIQREQNAIIRNREDPVLVIQGAAGSGKTSVALHRIAYLLYHEKGKLRSSNILILSPNSVFSDYISHILPELGEENIQEMSFDLFAYRELKEIAADCEERCDQIERLMAGCSWQEQEEYRRKQSEEMVGETEAFLAMLEDRLMRFADVEYRGLERSTQQIIRLFYFKFQEIPLLSRMDAVIEQFVDEYETLHGCQLPEEELELIRNKFMAMYVTRDIYEIYGWLLEEAGFAPLPDAELQRRRLAYGDVYPLLYLKYRLCRRQTEEKIRHLVVDEMQDYSYIQYAVLGMLFRCRMTILGDRAQTMDDRVQDVMQFLPRIFGKNIRRIHMNKSYRSTVEIASYACALAGIKGLELFERHGKPVEEKEFSEPEQGLEQIWQRISSSKEGAEDYETTAVLAMTEREAYDAYQYLNRRLQAAGGKDSAACSVVYVDRDSSKFEKGVSVTTFYLAKGLEFDRVFVLCRQETQPIFRQAEYICATRALHELSMYRLTPGRTGDWHTEN